MKELKLGDLFRYGLPGAVCLTAVVIAYSGIRRYALSHTGVFEATVLVGLSLVLGALVQTVHRGLVYPLIHRWILGRVLARRNNRSPASGALRFLENYFAPSESEITYFHRRFSHKRYESVAPWISDWSDRIHFAYATAWALAFGSLVPMALRSAVVDKALFDPPSGGVIAALIGAAALTFAVAMAEDFRAFSFESLLWPKTQA